MQPVRRSILILTPLVVVLIVGVVFAVFLMQKNKEHFLKVAFLDVGQGDSIFIQTPSNKQVLIDGGANRSVLGELGRVMPFWDRSLDVVIATHPDKDHIGGLLSVLENFRVDQFVDTGLVADTQVYKSLELLIDVEGATEVIAAGGLEILLDEEHGIVLEILWPSEKLSDDRNDTSIITKLSYGETSFLMTGDASVVVENRLVREWGELLDIDVLKLGHHGSKTSTSEIFLKATTPELAIISAGENNRYGHPNVSVIKRLKALHIPFLGTYKEGTIILKSDGETILVK